MTDKEIIKALGYCHLPITEGYCKKCPYYRPKGSCCPELIKDALDLINRQQAEIEKWHKSNLNIAKSIPELIEITRAEAIKEFAEKLKDRTYPVGCFISAGDKFVIGIDYIDELVKEMVGADNG